MAYFRETTIVVVVFREISLSYDYDGGLFQVGYGMGSRGPTKKKAAGESPAAFLVWCKCPNQIESNLTRLSMNSRRMLPVGPFLCLAMMISAMFLGYSWPGRT